MQMLAKYLFLWSGDDGTSCHRSSKTSWPPSHQVQGSCDHGSWKAKLFSSESGERNTKKICLLILSTFMHEIKKPRALRSKSCKISLYILYNLATSIPYPSVKFNSLKCNPYGWEVLKEAWWQPNQKAPLHIQLQRVQSVYHPCKFETISWNLGTIEYIEKKRTVRCVALWWKIANLEPFKGGGHFPTFS